MNISASRFAPDPTATLVIRLWMSAEEPLLRARLIEVRADTQVTVAAVAGEGRINEAVARWLSQWAAGPTMTRPGSSL
jgi:hypothetical protein